MSTDLREEISRALNAAGLRGARLLVGVSGGLDSVALVRLLAALGEAEVEIAHVDHGLRPDSGEDARFVRALAGELGAPFHELHLAPGDFRPGESLQAEARRLRREFFEATLAARNLKAVALAHHADDQAETVLLKLLRGAGPRGAAAMRLFDPPYFRPLLHVPRSALAEAAALSGWRWREDPSNRSDRYLRNRVRRELLPALVAVDPAAVAALGRFAELQGEDERFLSRAARIELERLAVPEPEGVRLPAAEAAALPAPIRRRLLLALHEAAGGEAGALSLAHLGEVEALLAPGRAHRLAPTPGVARFYRSGEDLWAVDERRLRPLRELLDGEGATGVAPAGEAPPGVETVRLEAGRPRGALSFRPRRAGDRLVLEGKSVKVKDLLMEARLPRWRRDRAVVAEDAAGVAALLAPGASWPRFGEGSFAAWVRAGWWLSPTWCKL